MPSVLVARVLALVVFGSYACTCEWLVGRFLPVHWVHIVVHAWCGVPHSGVARLEFVPVLRFSVIATGNGRPSRLGDLKSFSNVLGTKRS